VCRVLFQHYCHLIKTHIIIIIIIILLFLTQNGVLPGGSGTAIIQFNSILYYLCAESTATRPITDTAQYRYT
jgi:hypothetical protein